MTKVLTLEMYRELRERSAPNGFTVDKVIQTGVDNPGKITLTRARIRCAVLAKGESESGTKYHLQ